jgi:hypothetical protein
MDLHNLCFSIWYHNMLQSGKNQIYSTGLLIYLHSFIDTLYNLINLSSDKLLLQKILQPVLAISLLLTLLLKIKKFAYKLDVC